MKKRTIFINIALAFIFALFLYFLITEIQAITSSSKWLITCLERLNRKLEDPDSVGNTLVELERGVSRAKNSIFIEAIWLIVFSFAILFCVFIFIYCNPLLFRRSTWTNLSEEWAKNKQERAAARAEKAEADKQKRIEELQAELEELKKDE